MRRREGVLYADGALLAIPREGLLFSPRVLTRIELSVESDRHRALKLPQIEL